MEMKKYKVKIDFDHPAGKVIFIVPEWASKENPVTNVDDCFIWTHKTFEDSGLEDGEVFDIDMSTGLKALPAVKTPMEEVIEKSHELMGQGGNVFNQWFIDNEDRLLVLEKELLNKTLGSEE